MMNISLGRAMPCRCKLSNNGSFSFIKVKKIGCQNKGIVSCDGGTSKEGHPHTSLSVPGLGLR